MDHEARHSLEDLIDREIDAAQRLAGVLTAERIALTGDSPETVYELAADKIKLLAGIETMESERRVLWAASEAGNDPLSAGIAERWGILMALMAACRSANDVNGQIIHIRRNQVRQLFDIVRGGAALTYGPEGRASTKALRALARA